VNPKEALAVILFLIGLTLAVVLPITSRPALANSYPGFAYSHYMGSNSFDTTTLSDKGCDLANAQDSGSRPTKAMVVFDYGHPDYQSPNYGTRDFSNVFRTLSTIEIAAEDYLDGYFACVNQTSSNKLTLLLGTNNDNTTGHITETQGEKWGTAVNAVYNWMNNAGYSSHEDVRGADDIEPDFATYTATKSWLDGYGTTGTHVYDDYGGAAGCPSTTHSNGSCDNGWNQNKVQYVSWGDVLALPLPEIYRTDGIQADQWHEVDLYSVNSLGTQMYFDGSFTQSKACSQVDMCGGSHPTNNTPSQGWNQLYNALNSTSGTAQSLLFATDIEWEFP